MAGRRLELLDVGQLPVPISSWPLVADDRGGLLGQLPVLLLGPGDGLMVLDLWLSLRVDLGAGPAIRYFQPFTKRFAPAMPSDFASSIAERPRWRREPSVEWASWPGRCGLATCCSTGATGRPCSNCLPGPSTNSTPVSQPSLGYAHRRHDRARWPSRERPPARESAGSGRALAERAGLPTLTVLSPVLDLPRREGEPAAVVCDVDAEFARLPAVAFAHPLVLTVRWCRAECLRELGENEGGATELRLARDDCAAEGLYEPPELLGLLVGRATDLADVDPPRAARVLASVHAHRRHWVLPFGIDRTLRDVSARLPASEGPPPSPTSAL